MIEYLRLAFGTVCVLLPGWAVARALGQRTASATLAWAMACLFVAWAAVFVVHANIRDAAIVLGVIFLTAVILGRRRPATVRGAPGWVLAFGVALGAFVWRVEGAVVGDAPFHEARVRKLVMLGDLHLKTVDEFKDGGLHPGYAFPLWHGFLALVGWVSGVDAGGVVRHEPSLLVPLACVVAWEAGEAVFGHRLAGAALLAAQLAVFCFGPGHGGSFATLALPGSAARILLVPAVLALFFAAPDARGLAAVAVASGALALVHPTYAVFLLIPLLAVLWWRWRGWLAAAVPVGLAVLWLKPIVDQTVSHNPSASALQTGFAQYRSQLAGSVSSYRLAPEVMGRSGAVAVAALVLLPVVALALRRQWAAFVLGGTLIVLLVMEVPWLFMHFSDAVSLSQSRRAAGFAPLPFALVGALALLARTVVALPLALACGIVLQRLWPGDFDYGLRHGGPAAATWIALVGGGAALLVALVVRHLPVRERFRLGAAAMLLFVLPIVVHGLWHWSPAHPTDPNALSPRLVHNLRTRVPKGAVVIAPVQASYEVAAVAPVYIVAAPVAHVANTKANDPYGRAKAVRHWVATGDPSVPRRYGATWQIRAGRLSRIP